MLAGSVNVVRQMCRWCVTVKDQGEREIEIERELLYATQTFLVPLKLLQPRFGSPDRLIFGAGDLTLERGHIDDRLFSIRAQS